MSVSLNSFDPAEASQALLRSLHDLYIALDAEDLPDDPSMPFERRVKDWKRDFARFPVQRWVLQEGESVVGAALAHYDLKENLQNGFGRVMVHPDHRGRGHAKLLAEPLFDHLESAGRSRVGGWITAGHPAEGLAASLGLEPALHERRSRLVVADIDSSLMADWIERASERAGDYELLRMRSPFPDEHLAKYCEMMTIMNTAPLEDFEMEDEHLSPEDWRDIEKSVMDVGDVINNLTAVHKPTGEFVGFTQVKTEGLRPELAWQWDTGVHPEHRNKGLGRWLKAAMIVDVLERYPAVERIDTENAGSNEPMLNINFAMGFKPIHDANIWQGDLAIARERLGV